MLPPHLGVLLMLTWLSPLWVPAILLPLSMKRHKRLTKRHVVLLVSCEFTLLMVAVCLFADVQVETFRLSLLLWPAVVVLFSISALARPRTLSTAIILLVLAGVLILYALL